MRKPTKSLSAPGASGYDRMELPGANHLDEPCYNDHVVEPETRQEMIDGVIVEAQPANPPHGDRHFDLDYVLRAHVASGYVGSTDMLTRTSRNWNFAADASVRKEGVDPETGARYLEELAFEVKSTQSTKDITDRARQLYARGVRRVFAIWVKGDAEGRNVKNGPVKEWSPRKQCWMELQADEEITDPCLRRPIEVRALLDALEADNAVAKALLAKKNPILTKRVASSYKRGKSAGQKQERRQAIQQERRQAIRDLCEVLAIELTPQRQVEIDSLDAEGLDELRGHLKQHRCWYAK